MVALLLSAAPYHWRPWERNRPPFCTDGYGCVRSSRCKATAARAVHTNGSVAADAADSQGGNNQSVHVRLCPLPSVTVRFAAINGIARVCGVAADAADSQGGNNQSVHVRYRLLLSVLPPSTVLPAHAA